MTQAEQLYGTSALPPRSERITLGDLSFTLEDGALRHIRIGDKEIIRGIAFLVRDRDWGTTMPNLAEVSRQASGRAFAVTFAATYVHGDAQMTAMLRITATPDQLEFAAEAAAQGAFETNRTGFTVLHPAALSGCDASIQHSDGTAETATFPDLIAPWQPFMDIVRIEHRADGLEVQCALNGDTFEMEDQRQWGDASYKTYNRPLAKPWPYTIADGDSVTQSVTVTWRAAAAAARPTAATPEHAPANFPETAILVMPEQVPDILRRADTLVGVAPQRLLCHVDDTSGPVADQFDQLAQVQRNLPQFRYDLELVSRFHAPPAPALHDIRAKMDASGFSPESVLVCPAVDRQSTPPGSAWPVCPPLEEVHQASADCFGDRVRGGGMVSFFPELNRKRPPVEMLDFVGHGLCPIVHAADDLSVLETLEAIPHITRSARAIIGAKGYRIGPSTIAMRHNPYGQRTIPNPNRERVCMADDDPRHGALFGAAYVIGLAAALAPANAQVWTPIEASGPRGLRGPIIGAVQALARCAGQPVHKSERIGDIAALLVGGSQFTVNLSPSPQQGLGPFEWRVIDA